MGFTRRAMLSFPQVQAQSAQNLKNQTKTITAMDLFQGNEKSRQMLPAAKKKYIKINNHHLGASIGVGTWTMASQTAQGQQTLCHGAQLLHWAPSEQEKRMLSCIYTTGWLVSENGDVLTGRLIVPFNSPGGSADILTTPLARAAPAVAFFGWSVWVFFNLFIYFGAVASLLPQTVAIISISLPGIASVNEFAGRNNWHNNPYCWHHYQSLHS